MQYIKTKRTYNVPRQYLPQVLSSCTADAAVGFMNLASCHMMEFDFMPSTLYLKLSKSVAQTIWKMQQIDQKSVIDAADPAPVVIHSIIRSLQLDLTSFNSEGNICEAM